MTFGSNKGLRFQKKNSDNFKKIAGDLDPLTIAVVTI
jgi:hypothetical protein